MAALVKLGTRWINLDHVMEIQDNGTSLRVYYSVAHGAHNEIDSTEIMGSDASALRTFLDSIGTDILADFGGAGPSSDRRTKNVAQEGWSNIQPRKNGPYR